MPGLYLPLDVRTNLREETDKCKFWKGIMRKTFLMLFRKYNLTLTVVDNAWLSCAFQSIMLPIDSKYILSSSAAGF